MIFAALLLLAPMQETPKDAEIETAGKLIGLEFRSDEIELMRSGVAGNRASFEKLRALALSNDVLPALRFSPLLPGREAAPSEIKAPEFELEIPGDLARPDDLEDLAYASIPELAALIKTRKVSCVELTEMYLARLTRLDAQLHCVITLTSERALKQAAELDAELERGEWRGVLHGIPWGAKDLLAVRGYRTTWGAKPFENQVLDLDATVVRRLDDAGAVLIAKLTLGALAWGDVWFGEKTRNPWQPESGSSGSSAGPASATAAGCVAFAIGSETLGSIISPSERCGNSSLRPTFGRVSRHGAMALSWSMDKLGPMCRTAEDCALVFDAIHGADAGDTTSTDAPFGWIPDISALRIGYLEKAFEEEYGGREADLATLEVLREIGVSLEPVALPARAVGPLLTTLQVEAAAAFDEITQNREIDKMVRQVRNAWPNTFRGARFVPAVEYVQANRYRTLLMQEMEAVMEQVDVFVSPSFQGGALSVTNLTGHPAVVVPNRFDLLEDHPTSLRRSPGSITFMGGLYKDDAVLAVAHTYQQHTSFHRRRPPIQ